ncbi:MAG: hypothetical protein NZM94_04690 [Roseiflexus sp.]|nr:hypothetical protein [Roseiflexus sp.]
MQYTRLGRTGLRVSRLCLGTMNFGPRTVEQLNGSLRALEISLSDEALARLDAIWPGPGGPAPEAYAW